MTSEAEVPDTSEWLDVPTGWEAYDRAGEPADGTVLVALEPVQYADDGRARFRSNLVVTAVTTAGLTFRDWQVGTDQILDRALTEYLLIDLERLDIDGRSGGRRLAHHRGPHGEALTLEQWFTIRDGVGHTLTATVETARYDELADLTAATAASWRPAGTPASNGVPITWREVPDAP